MPEAPGRQRSGETLSGAGRTVQTAEPPSDSVQRDTDLGENKSADDRTQDNEGNRVQTQNVVVQNLIDRFLHADFNRRLDSCQNRQRQYDPQRCPILRRGQKPVGQTTLRLRIYPTFVVGIHVTLECSGGDFVHNRDFTAFVMTAIHNREIRLSFAFLKNGYFNYSTFPRISKDGILPMNL